MIQTSQAHDSGSAGADLAILALHKGGWSIRYGGFAMVELHSAAEHSIATTALWRGLFGGSMAVSADRLAKQWLPSDRGKLEATVSVRHESEHESVGTITSKRLGVGTTGNFVMPDLAARLGLGEFDLELRAQTKVFLPEHGYAPVVRGQPGRWQFVLSPIYEVGPGADLIWRWRVHPRAHPFWSTFVEYLVGREVNALVEHSFGATVVTADVVRAKVPDAYLLRTQLGVILPFEPDPPWRVVSGDLQLFHFLEYGHGEGLLRYDKDLRIGTGMRGVLFR